MEKISLIAIGDNYIYSWILSVHTELKDTMVYKFCNSLFLSMILLKLT